ncbi:MAG: ATP synthase subunit I [Desulfobacterales bacterium]|nr:ATP synthase subunit I [Desulfobacterales bacterium]
MEAIRKTEIKYCSRALTIALAVGIVCFLLALIPMGKGFILGSLFSIANFIIMGETLPLRIGHTRRKSTGISLVSMVGRYAMLAIPLALAVKTARFDLAATICGLFIVQLMILSEHVFHLIHNKFRKPRLF